MENPDFFTRNKRWILALLVIVGAIAIFILLLMLRAEEEETAPDVRAALVETRDIELQPLQLQVTSQGMVQPKYQTQLVAEVSGELIRVHDSFVRGGFVAKDELLAEIDPLNYEVQMENALASLASAEASLGQEEALSEVARVEWEGVQNTPAPALGLRKPQLAQARAQVKAAQAALKRAEKDLQRTRILAPYDALVTAREVSPGAFVNVGGPIGTVMDTSIAEVRLPIPDNDLQYLPGNGVGGAVELRVSGKPEHLWQTHIVRAEGVVDTETRMRYLVAEVRDPYQLETGGPEAQELAFGSYVMATLEGHSLPEAVVIPRAQVRDSQVAVYEEGKLVFKSVKVLRNTDGNSIITEGLSAGDQLIITALDFPVAGMALEKMADAEPAAVADVAAPEGDQ
ncbi:MAG TPA: efflux RND transporter periplasmic adaptor subunit [Cellvibrionaceae bacterium]